MGGGTIKRVSERGKKEALKDFGGRAEKGNRAVRGGEGGGFPGFKDGED